MRNAHFPQKGSFFSGSGRGKHLGLCLTGELKSGQPHTAGRVVYKNAVAGGYPATYHEPEVCRHKGYGQRGRFLDSQAFRLPDDQGGLRGYVTGHGRRYHPHNYIVDFHGVSPASACNHLADAFPTEGRWTRQ